MPSPRAAVSCLLALSLVPLSLPAAELELAPLIKEGTPGDLLMQDPIVPSWQGQAQQSAASGSIQESLGDQLAMPVTGTGAAGGFSQFRGVGRSSEDTDVQALGIPLNAPQGGGFDLSIFPQFLWASYEFQPGPALGTFDPRGTAGSLRLVPWTEQALGAGARTARVAALGSTAAAYQVSAAYSDGRSVAAVAGSSSGDAQGPSGAVSLRWEPSPRDTVSLHLLFTDLDALSPGPADLTPRAHQLTARWIPLLQLESRLGSEGLLRSSVFLDDEYLRYDDPSASGLPLTQDHSTQLGTENALFWGDWRLGAGLRGIQYATLGSGDESELTANLLLSRSFEFGRGFLVEPTLRGVGVSGYGMLPEASVGIRQEGSAFSWHARAGLSRNFPSLVNRFYSYPGFPGYPGFAGNPGLAPEEDWTSIAGADVTGGAWKGGLEAYAQFARDAQVRAPLIPQATDTILNLGNAWVGSLLARLECQAAPWLELASNVTFNASQVSETGLQFPGLPGVLAVLSAVARFGGIWQVRAFERVSSVSAGDGAGNSLPAYHEENLDVQARLASSWLAMARFEDLLDQRPELVPGYPGVGREFSMLLSWQP